MPRRRAKQCGVLTTLQLYLREIEGESSLSEAEEGSLVEAIAGGDGEARSRIIRAHLPLVVKIARCYAGRGMVLGDLIGEGNLGLIRAAEKFNSRFGTRFGTYAAFWIKEAILQACINTECTIRLPKYMVGLLTKWRRAEEVLRREDGRPPSSNEVAEFLHLSATQRSLVASARQARQLKLGCGIKSDADGWSPDNPVDGHEPPETRVEADEERAVLLREMDCMSAQERAVVSLHYGLEGGLPLTLKEIGRRLCVCGECVRQIELGALRKLGGRIDSSKRRGASRSVPRSPAFDLPRAENSKHQGAAGRAGRERLGRRAKAGLR